MHTSEALLASLSSPQYGRPLGLAAVIEQSIREEKLVSVDEFLSSKSSIYASRDSWLPSPWSIINWSLRTVGISSASSGWTEQGNKLKAGEFVVMTNVEKLAENVERRQREHEQNATGSLSGRLWSRDEFVKSLDLAAQLNGTSTLADTDLKILLRYLERDKQIISYNDRVVKFKTPSAARPDPITHQDITIISLNTLINNMTAQCADLTTRISRLNAKAALSVKSSNRISALALLRSKRLAESALKQRGDTLTQLEETLAKIEQAATQVEIVQVMQSSATVLKDLNKQVGDLDRVEDIVEGLREEINKVDETEKILAEPLSSATTETLAEAEIDQELERMEREEQGRQERISEREPPVSVREDNQSKQNNMAVERDPSQADPGPQEQNHDLKSPVLASEPQPENISSSPSLNLSQPENQDQSSRHIIGDDTLRHQKNSPIITSNSNETTILSFPQVPSSKLAQQQQQQQQHQDQATKQPREAQ